LKYFKKSEFECPCCGALPSTWFMHTIDQARGLAQIPFRINSGMRCPEHNKKVGGVKDSAHTNGEACDIQCKHPQYRFKIVNAALNCGITRIGIYGTFIHLDTDKTKPQEVIWYG